MLLAIDVGNTHTVFGRFDGKDWEAVWRLPTRDDATEDLLAAEYYSLCRQAALEPRPQKAICANVVPALTKPLKLFAEKYLHIEMPFLSYELLPDIVVRYSPPSAVGADRLANAVGAIEKYGAPCLVVDFGTATTIDVVSSEKAYEGGVILPGVELALTALSSRAAKLPSIELVAPTSLIGKDTQTSLQSGFVYGYSGAIDTLVRMISDELGETPKVVATGGLAKMFAQHCETIDTVDVTLTLDGLRLIAAKLG
jgi:type III pantothenate kinase